MAKMPEAPLTPEQQQARNKENAALLGKIAEYAPFIPNFKSNNAEVKPAAESQAQTSQATQPAAPTSTSNLASLDTAPAFKPVEAKTIAAPSVIPKVSPIKAPTSVQGVDVIQGGGKNGTNLYTNVPNDTGNVAQSQAVNRSAQQRQQFAPQEEVATTQNVAPLSASIKFDNSSPKYDAAVANAETDSRNLARRQMAQDSMSGSSGSGSSVGLGGDGGDVPTNTAQAQSQVVNRSTQPQGYLTMPQQQPRLSQEQIRQIYREDPTIAMGMQNATGIDENGNRLENNPQNRAAEQNRLLTLNPIQQQDPNAYRNSLIAQANTFGHFGDAARRKNALAQLGLLDNKEQNKENNLAKQQIADQENALKSSLYQSEALRNEAQTRAALTPKQPKPEYHYNEDGTATVIENGLQRKVQTDPRQKLVDKYNTEWAASEALADDDPNKEVIQNQLKNAVSQNNLSDWVDF